MWAYGPRYYTDTTPVFFVLFLGPFSNQYGRKILMVAPLIGHVLATLIRIANYYAVTLPAEYILLLKQDLAFFYYIYEYCIKTFCFSVVVTTNPGTASQDAGMVHTATIVAKMGTWQSSARLLTKRNLNQFSLEAILPQC